MSHETAETCGQLCAEPMSDPAAWLLLVIDLCHLVPMQLFLIVFYFIPRRYYLSGEEEDIDIDKLDIKEPLLEINEALYEKDWDEIDN